MFSDGWVKLHRRFAEWEWYKTPNMVHLFVHLLVSANHENGRWQGVDVLRGQVITGRRSLSNATGISEKSIRNCLARLELTGEISKKTASKYSIITICKYNEYQTPTCNEGPARGQQGASKGPARGQQGASKGPARGHKQEEEECKKEKNKNIARPACISEKSWVDLVSLRKKTRGAMTERAINTLVQEFEKASEHGYTVDQCIDEMCNRSWRGFKAAWMNNAKKGQPTRSKRDEANATRSKWARELLDAENADPGNERMVNQIQDHQHDTHSQAGRA